MTSETNDDPDLEADKDLKIKIPTRLHLLLHKRKILTGTTMSSTVEQALTMFFEEDEQAPEDKLQ